MTNQFEAKHPSHVKVATASLIGTAIEWYDFFLYGTAGGADLQQIVLPHVRPVNSGSGFGPASPPKATKPLLRKAHVLLARAGARMLRKCRDLGCSPAQAHLS